MGTLKTITLLAITLCKECGCVCILDYGRYLQHHSQRISCMVRTKGDTTLPIKGRMGKIVHSGAEQGTTEGNMC